MAGLRAFYFGQLVNNTFLNSVSDLLEEADHNLAVDIGVEGIITGGVGQQHEAGDLTVDVTGACLGYDQTGRRCFFATTQNLNCAQDENSVSTAVAGAGNERWISVQLRFYRDLQDPQTDDNGFTVWTTQNESYELAVVMATEQTLGTNLKPTEPTDSLLLFDVKLIYGQSQILTADFNIDRRDTFQIWSASQIPVTSSGWTFLDPATDFIQATLDFIEDRIIQRDGSQEILEDLVPDVAVRDLGTASKQWNLFLSTLTADSSTRIVGNLLPNASGQDLGSGALLWDIYTDIIVNNHSTYTGAIKFAEGKSVAGRVLSIGPVEHLSGSTWGKVKAQSLLARTFNGQFDSTGGSTEFEISLDNIPDGVDLEELYYTAAQTNTPAAMVFDFIKITVKGVETSIKSRTISAFGSWVDDEAIGIAGVETINWKTHRYILRVTAPATVDSGVSGLKADWKITDIVQAAN